MNEDQGKRFADKSARMTRESLEKGVAAAEETARALSKAIPRLPKAFAILISD